MSTQILLVPGFWLGAWAWDEVEDLLRSRGFEVTALTLPGLEETQIGEADVTLDDHVEAIVEALDRDADRRILVVHSGAAFAGALVLDRNPELVDRFVLVDTAIPADGTAFNPDAGDDFTLDEAWDALEEEGSFGELTADQLAEFQRRAVPEPKAILATPVHYRNEARTKIPVTAICTVFPSAEYRRYAEAGEPTLAGLLDFSVDWVDLPTGHWPMWSRPEELAEIIAQAANE